MNMKKKMKLFFFSFFLTFNFLNAENFNDASFLLNKYRIKLTVKELDKVKNMYEPGSHEYTILQQVENYFLNKFPVDTFGTYSRIKLHNVINNAENRLQKYYSKLEKDNQTNILSADVDLNRLYLEKQKKLAELKKKEKERAKLKQQKNVNPQEEYMNLLKQFMPK